jgi:hypothetical protein
VTRQVRMDLNVWRGMARRITTEADRHPRKAPFVDRPGSSPNQVAGPSFVARCRRCARIRAVQEPRCARYAQACPRFRDEEV